HDGPLDGDIRPADAGGISRDPGRGGATARPHRAERDHLFAGALRLPVLAHPRRPQVGARLSRFMRSGAEFTAGADVPVSGVPASRIGRRYLQEFTSGKRYANLPVLSAVCRFVRARFALVRRLAPRWLSLVMR